MRPGPAGIIEAASAPRPARRTLFHRYGLYLAGLVSAVLLVNGAINLAFSYVELRTLLEDSQRERLQVAVQRIEQFVRDLDTLAVATMRFGQVAPEGDVAALRVELIRLLRQAPAISELTWVGSDGHPVVAVSRLGADPTVDGDLSEDPAVVAARRDRHFAGAVVFRQESEPYMTLAVADGVGRRGREVLIAQVNLKLIREFLAGLKVVASRDAYVVDRRGLLIAHPDMDMVLRKTDLAQRPQVRAALDAPVDRDPGVSIWRESVSGDARLTLTAHQAIPALGWSVFVEQPLTEAYAPLIGAATRDLIQLGFGIVIAVAAALLFARQLSRPIQALSETAARLGEGELDARVELDADDELHQLAQQFNRMADRLGESQEQLEARIAERTDELARANQAQARFLAAASHDLRQPTHALGLYVAQLKDTRSAAEHERLIGRIEASSTAVAQLLDALFDLSKLDAGKVAAAPRVIAVQTLLNRLEQHFALAARAKGLQLRVRPSARFVRVDPLLLERVLMNLVSNAVRHTVAGGVLVACRDRGDALRVSVWDTGIGIAAAEQSRVFDEFYQAPVPAGEATKGLGLGLAIVRRIALLLAAPITLRSVEGRGSMFAIDVPLASAAAGAAAAPEPALVAGLNIGFEGATVLLIDDDDAARDAAAGLLQRWGWRVLAAADAAQALALAATLPRPPDVIVSDYRLGRDTLGTTLIEALRAHYGLRIASVIVTGDAPQSLGAEAAALAIHVLGKPLQPAPLRAVLQHLRSLGAPPPLRAAPPSPAIVR